jgi:hypothetical protein
MNNLDEIMNSNMGKETERVKQDFEKTNDELWKERKDKIKNFTDWFRVPLNLLIVGILLIGAVLMYNSIYAMTGLFLVAILSPLISEIGILSWEIGRERTKNTELQTKIATFQRGWHVLASVTLLVINFAIETAQETLMIRVDGAVWVVFAIIGMTAFMDIVQYYRYNDADRETVNKRKFQQKIDILNAETKEQQLDAFAEAERIKSESLVRYWKQNAPELATILGEIEAKKKIRQAYKDMGLSDDQIEIYMSKIKLKSGEVFKENKEENVRTERTEEKTKRPYNRKEKPPTLEKESSETQDKDSGNFTNGVEETSEADW